MPAKKIKKFLDENGVHYTTIKHSQAFTANQVAASAHISGYDLAKTVMVWIDGKLAMAVLPASMHIDFKALKNSIGSNNVTLASESDFKKSFPDCEVGTMPPFGNLYDMDVYVDENLAKDHKIAFSAGSHTELIQMNYSDFEKFVNPELIRFTREEGIL